MVIMQDIGSSSRGDDIEMEHVLRNLLHSEGHLMEEIGKDPHNFDLINRLGETVRTRQATVKEWAGNRINPSGWCNAKHMIIAEMHAEEALSNAARQERVKEEDTLNRIQLVKEIGVLKKKAVEDFLSGDEGTENLDDNVCMRCFGDLNIKPHEVYAKTEHPKETNPGDGKKLMYVILGIAGAIILYKLFTTKENSQDCAIIKECLIRSAIPRIINGKQFNNK